jgi:hypothetical protein
MSYQFADFFALADEVVMQDAKRTWPGCRARLVTAPFHGIGVAVPERALTYGEPEEAYEWAIAMWNNIETTLPDWSRHYPDVSFVFPRTDCFGGNCLYEGYTCRDGVIIERMGGESVARGGDALRRLIRYLGVELGAPPYFEPLVRGYFDAAE